MSNEVIEGSGFYISYNASPIGCDSPLGETALVAATSRPMTAFAREPSTVLKISRTLFHQILEKHPATAARVRALFQDRLTQFAAGLKIDA